MSPAELLRVVAFLTVVALVYLAALRHLVAIWGRFRRRRAGEETAPLKPSARRRRAMVFTLALLGIGCMAYGFLIEPYWLEVTHLRLDSSKVLPGTGPVRIVHLSDFHCDPTPRLEPDVVAAARDAAPDLIFFTGDCINSPGGLSVFRRTLAALAEIAPTYVIKGNYDVWYWTDMDRFGGTGVHELDGESVLLDVKGVPLRIAGSAFGSDASLDRALSDCGDRRFTIFLDHSPHRIPAAAGRGVDLVLSGHIHGGQIALPLYGALITLTPTGKKFERGLYEVGNTRAYVSRGIGMEGGIMPRVRFWARPELTIIELVGGGDQAAE